MASSRLLTPPAGEPVALAEVMEHLNLTEGSSLTLASLLIAARQKVEDDTGHSLLCQQWITTFPSFSSPLVLPCWPVIAIDSIQYVDANNALQTLSTYEVDLYAEPTTIRAVDDLWPITRSARENIVRIQYHTGFATPCTFDATTNRVALLGRNPVEDEILRFSNSGGRLPSPLQTKSYVADQVVSNTCFVMDGVSAVDLQADGSGSHFVGTVPSTYVQAIKLLVGHWYENREASTDLRAVVTRIPYGYDDLIWAVRRTVIV